MPRIDFWALLSLTQEYISERYSAVLTEKEKLPQLAAYIEQYLRDSEYAVDGMDVKELTARLYREMAEYSILTPYLTADDIEEVNINSWDDIAVTDRGGKITKLAEHFHSPGHSVDIVKRLLHHSGMIIDNATPVAQGHLPGNTRVTALKEPVVDKETGIACSIRLLRPNTIDRETLLKSEFVTSEMLAFLETCVRYGVSLVIAGATSSGKTTLLNVLLQSIPDTKRIFSIESGSRELSAIRRKDGRVMNNAVHTLSRPSENPAYDISQEDMVVMSLRFNPDVVVVGEMRDTEAYAAVEASQTGHTVLSTVHSGAGDAAHMRIALLCQKRFPIDFMTSLVQAGQAFPIVVYVHQLENKVRRIMDISECVILPDGGRRYSTLYRFNITKNTVENGQTVIDGRFEKPNEMSESLSRKLIQFGIPVTELQSFMGGE